MAQLTVQIQSSDLAGLNFYEVATGVIDGVNQTYTVSQPYVSPPPFLVFWDGTVQNGATGFVLTLSNPATGEFKVTPAPNPDNTSKISVLYWKA